MKLKIKQDIPIKYELGAYRVLPDYPTPECFLFDIISFILNKKKKVNYKLEDFQVKLDSFKSIFKFEINDEFKLKIKNILIELRDSGLITTSEGKIQVLESGLSKFFKIESK